MRIVVTSVIVHQIIEMPQLAPITAEAIVTKKAVMLILLIRRRVSSLAPIAVSSCLIRPRFVANQETKARPKNASAVVEMSIDVTPFSLTCVYE